MKRRCWRVWARELVAGLALGGLGFLMWAGFNVLPLLFIMVVAGALLYTPLLHHGRKSFAVVGRDMPAAAVTFADIGGQDVAIRELREALDFVRQADTLAVLDIRPLRGILLYGPPGTGKTLLAKAAAQYIDGAFVACSGSDMVEMYAGVGAARVRDLFHQARQLARHDRKQCAVVFIDEVEIIGAQRGRNTSHMEYEQTLNALLTEIDGISTAADVKILVIAATNRRDMLDQALLRPGRLDRQVQVSLPDKAGRLSILRIHTSHKPLAADVNLTQLADESFGFSGAQLESLCNEAAILAMRAGATAITQEFFRQAIDKVMLGEKTAGAMAREERRRIAVHEAGHAIISELRQPGSVVTVTIASRSQALGYVRRSAGVTDTYLFTQRQLETQMAVAVAGSAAEKLIYGERSTGAEADFQEAVKIAKAMIAAGMSPLGIVSAEDLPAALRHETANGMIMRVEQDVSVQLAARQQLLQTVAEELQQREVLSGAELKNLMACVVVDDGAA